MTDSPPNRISIHRADLRHAVTIAAVLFGTMMLTVAVTQGRDGVFRSDADLFRQVASDPFGDGSAIATPESSGVAYRYGRILYPLAGWIFGAGRAGATEVALAVVAVAGGVVAVGVAATLLARRGRLPSRSLWLFVVPGVWIGGIATYSESVVLALLLCALLAELDERRVLATCCFAAMLLAREAAAVALVPAFLADVRTRGPRALPRWLSTVAPLLAWWVWVRVRTDGWPFLDPTLSRREALSAPFVGVVEAAGETRFDAMGWAVVLAGFATVICAIAVTRRSDWHLVPATGLALALVIPILGVNVWRWPGEALRVLALPQALVVLAAIDLRESKRPAFTIPGNLLGYQ